MLLAALCCMNGRAQSPLRQAETAAKVKKSNANNLTLRAKLMYPTQEPMSEDVVWRRDVYRELNLNDNANAALYYPVEPTDGRMNLFTLLFKWKAQVAAELTSINIVLTVMRSSQMTQKCSHLHS